MKIEAPEKRFLAIWKTDISRKESRYRAGIKEAVEDSYKRLIDPAIEREILVI